jgi:copper transporter 1
MASRLRATLLLAACLLAGRAWAMDMPGMAMEGSAMAPAPAATHDGGMHMAMGRGSRNMKDACYEDPSKAKCKGFERSDEDWNDDLDQLCDAMPYMPGCSLRAQCEACAANGKYCEPSSLVADVCAADMPKMKGCEAWVALCASNTTVVAQCTKPGPVPKVPSTMAVREAINSLCSTHYMDGCYECEPWEGPNAMSFANCSGTPGPLPILAHQCSAMPDMPECTDSGFKAMCADADVAATFPAICTNPPNPHTGEAAPVLPDCTPAAGAPAPAPAEHDSSDGHDHMDGDHMDMAAPAPQAANATSAAFSELAPQAAAFLVGALLAAMVV